jgi:hypothetical protein
MRDADRAAAVVRRKSTDLRGLQRPASVSLRFDAGHDVQSALPYHGTSLYWVRPVWLELPRNSVFDGFVLRPVAALERFTGQSCFSKS